MIEEDATMTTLIVGPPEQSGREGEWPAWESRRTRQLDKAGPWWLTTNQIMLQGRNFVLTIEKSRSGSDFVATWRFSGEIHVSKWRIERDGQVSFALVRGTEILFSQVVPGVAMRCHDWQAIALSGTLDPALFDAVTHCGFSSGDISVRRC